MAERWDVSRATASSSSARASAAVASFPIFWTARARFVFEGPQAKQSELDQRSCDLLGRRTLGLEERDPFVEQRRGLARASRAAEVLEQSIGDLRVIGQTERAQLLVCVGGAIRVADTFG